MSKQPFAQLPPRLRSTAKYSAFHPQALATCHSYTPDKHRPLAAISSKNQVILFDITQPYEPLLLFHSAHNHARSLNLQFSHDARMVASSYDDSVLIYDCTGEALMPLITRISHRNAASMDGGYHHGDAASNNNNNNRNNGMDGESIQYLAWRQQHNNQQLITCSSSTIAQWDLRCNTDRMRPSISFSGEEFVSVVPSTTKDCEIATMSRNGIVTIYDERMKKRGGGNDSSGGDHGSLSPSSSILSSVVKEYDHVAQFQSHTIGFGIASLDSYFVTWGMDDGNGNDDTIACTTIKVWADVKDSSSKSAENYWYMGTDSDGNSSMNTSSAADFPLAVTASASAASTRATSVTGGSVRDGTLNVSDGVGVGDGRGCIGKIDVENLTTVRTTFDPLQNGIVAISTPAAENGNGNGPSCTWQADLWSINVSSSSRKDDGVNMGSSYGSTCDLNRLASFRSGDVDDSFLSQMVGDDYSNGHLIAADLTCVPRNTSRTKSMARDSEINDPTSNAIDTTDCDLLLCCLNSTGYITTHVIPEASTLHYQNKESKNHDSRVPVSEQQRGSPFRYRVGMQTNTENFVKIYRSNDETKEFESAIMNSVGFSGRKTGQSDTDNYVGGNDFSFIAKGAIEGGQMQFDLDGLNEFEKKELGGKKHDLNVPGTSVGAPTIGDEELMVKELLLDQNKVDDQMPYDVVDPIKAIRVPCPRLCGATFTMGGELMTFRNTNVKNMWKWYASDHRSQSGLAMSNEHVQTPKSTGSSQPVFFSLEDGMSRISERAEGSSQDQSREFPRSFYDLIKMNEAAEGAQWGNERDDADNAADSRQSSSDSEEDSMIDTYSSSGSEDSFDIDLKSSANAIYDKYFGASAQPLHLNEGISADSANVSRATSGRQRSDSLMGPVMENLNSKVILFRDKAGYVMNGQCPELAEIWKLGPCKRYSKKAERRKQYEITNVSREEKLRDTDEMFTPLTKTMSMSVRHVIKKTSSETSLRGNASDPDLRRRENMVGTLQKLYDSKGSIAAPPPDQRVMQKGNSSVSFKEPMATFGVRDTPSTRTVSVSADLRLSGARMSDLIQRKEICLYNAKCAASMGQHAKADVWKLIAEILDSILSQCYDDYDGWHSQNGSALGRELLMNILKYYELNGDVQMLATITSVLRAGNNSEGQTNQENSSLFSLLLPEKGARYDLYIHAYGSLLYSWGKLTTRAELNKHLITSSLQDPGVECEKPKRWKGRNDLFVPFCPKCDQPANAQNVCEQCQEYVFRCSICTNAVRGLFTWCTLCGHGGHVNHLIPWFMERNECPTGCGCLCREANAMVTDSPCIPVT